jgi:Ammonium Transporter Family
LWWAAGYSLAFAHGTPFLGGLKYAWLRGVTSAPNSDYGAWVSQNVFAMYQLMFAIITPALIVGAIAERMKYSAVMTFIAIWMFVVYFPLAHMVWGADGLMNGVWNAKASIRAIDFAGGTVVHMSSGWSALVLCLILGKRTGFDRRAFLPHSVVLTMIGTGMLWVGWYGFNAGSAVGGGRHRGNRLHRHHAGDRGRRLGLAGAGMADPGEADRARLLLGRGGRVGRHHAGLGFRDTGERRDHRPTRRRRPVSRLHLAQGDLQVRRRAGHLRRARRGRHTGGALHRLLR